MMRVCLLGRWSVKLSLGWPAANRVEEFVFVLGS